MLGSDLFSIFTKYPEVVIVVSNKKEGNMKVNYELEEDTETLKNRERFLKRIGLNSDMVASAQLGHEDRIKIVAEKDLGKFSPGVDGLVTDRKNIYLAITVADCLPIFIYDPENKVIELLHAGWRGLAEGIIPQGVKALEKKFKSDPKKLLVGIGPAIGPCHFQVQEDVLNKLKEYGSTIEKRSGKYFIDLKKIAHEQLLRAGVAKNNIEVNPICTYHEENTSFSYRRDKSDPLEAMLVLMGLRS